MVSGDRGFGWLWNPRYIGLLLATVVLIRVSLVFSSFMPSLFNAIGWALAFGIGSRGQALAKILSGHWDVREIGLTNRSWGAGFWISQLYWTIATAFRYDFYNLFFANFLSINILYMLSKAGCEKYGCCRFENKMERLKVPDLPILEVWIALTTIVIAAVFWQLDGYQSATRVLVAGHTGSRLCVSLAACKGATIYGSVTRTDTGLIFVYGIVLQFVI